jgi:predicted amidohydrolase YtcJ
VTKRLAFFASAALLTACARPAAEAPADIVFRGGTVWTGDPAHPRVEAVAVRDGRIVFAGPEAGAERFEGPSTQRISLAGRMLLPGFHDAHVHPVSGGLALTQCDLSDLMEAGAIYEKIRAYVAAHPVPAGADPGTSWIRGHGWALPAFPAANPRKDDLDAIVPDRPVYMDAMDGHSIWVNSKALALAGITRNTPDPPNGRIERDPKTGEPSGTLREDAASLVAELLPRSTRAEAADGLRAAHKMAAGFGITSHTEAAASGGVLATYKSLQDSGELTARVSAALATDPSRGPEQVAELEALRAGTSGPLLSASSAKIFADGVIESHTAALLEPYLGGKGDDRGIANWSPEALDAVVLALDKSKFQVHVHAIGDRAIRMTLDAFEKAQQVNGRRDSRHHIAHLELIDPQDIPRFDQLGVAANFQPLWAWADPYIKDLTEPFLGPARSRWLYPMGSVAKTGAAVVCGSDWDVTSMDPLAAIQVAMTRQQPGDTQGQPWIPEERMTLEAMLDCYTRRGAWIDFRENETGTIEPGKFADLALLDHDLFAIPPAEIYKTRVLLTLLGGNEIYRAPNW